jgi:hypothetical protein
LSIVDELDPEVVLEFGTAYGTTVANVCAVSDARVYTVNALPEQIEGRVTTFTLTREEIGYVYRDCGFEERVVQVYANTKDLDILKYLPPGVVDVAIIDACHDSDFVVNDFLKVVPVLSDRAVVLLHDVHPSLRSHLAGPYAGSMYLRKMGYNVKHIEDTWWGVWMAEDSAIERGLMQQVLDSIDTMAAHLILGSGLDDDVRAVRRLAGAFGRSR